MPSHKLHRKFTKMILGKGYDDIHKAIDLPYVFYGSKHRKLFHDMDTVKMTFMLTQDLDKTLAVYTHIMLDDFQSRNRKFVEWLERLL